METTTPKLASIVFTGGSDAFDKSQLCDSAEYSNTDDEPNNETETESSGTQDSSSNSEDSTDDSSADDNCGIVFEQGDMKPPTAWAQRPTTKARVRKSAATQCKPGCQLKRVQNILQASTVGTLHQNYSGAKYSGGYHSWRNLSRWFHGDPGSRVKGLSNCT